MAHQHSEVPAVDGPFMEERIFFEAHHAELLARYPGKFVVLKGSELLSAFDTDAAAYTAGLEKFGNVPMYIRKIVPVQTTRLSSDWDSLEALQKDMAAFKESHPDHIILPYDSWAMSHPQQYARKGWVAYLDGDAAAEAARLWTIPLHLISTQAVEELARQEKMTKVPSSTSPWTGCLVRLPQPLSTVDSDISAAEEEFQHGAEAVKTCQEEVERAQAALEKARGAVNLAEVKLFDLKVKQKLDQLMESASKEPPIMVGWRDNPTGLERLFKDFMKEYGALGSKSVPRLASQIVAHLACRLARMKEEGT